MSEWELTKAEHEQLDKLPDGVGKLYAREVAVRRKLVKWLESKAIPIEMARIKGREVGQALLIPKDEWQALRREVGIE